MGVAPASAHLGCRQQSASEMLARIAVELASSTVLDVFEYDYEDVRRIPRYVVGQDCGGVAATE